MRLHRFYIPEKIGLQNEITIHSAELTNQIRRVFRLKTGDSIILFDGSGSDYECKIDGGDKDSLTFTIIQVSKSRFMPECEVILCAALVKKDTFEWIAEKATELGVTKIIPIEAERSEKKNLNNERLNKIVIEASEQSGRGSIPAIEKIMTLEEVIKSCAGATCATPINVIAFHTEGEAYAQVQPAQDSSIIIFIGPEGGWSEKEIELFHSNSIPVKCLGTQVLRAETAVVAALSVVMLGK